MIECMKKIARKQNMVIYMLKEIMARIAGIVVIIIIAIIVNFVLKRIPNDSNIKRFTEMG